MELIEQSDRATSHEDCNRDSVSCSGDGVAIEFPFGLKGVDNQNQNQSSRGCSYPKFQLSCDKQRQTIVNFPYSGDFAVKYINYEDQTIQVNDPAHCLPKRFLHDNVSLSVSPFQLDRSAYNIYNLTILRCPSNITRSYPLVIPCLNDSRPNYSVIAIWPPIVPSVFSESCHVISSISYPVSNLAMWPFWPDLTEDIQLTWSEPACGRCAASGQRCGFVKDTGLRVGCFPRSHTRGLSRSAKYALSIGLGLPGFLCLIGLLCCMRNKVRTWSAQRGRPSTEFPDTIALRPYRFVMGLDGQTIEKYPKTHVGESGRLPKPNHNTCSICLSEYQPKETLRTIPECNHYFHAISPLIAAPLSAAFERTNVELALSVAKILVQCSRKWSERGAAVPTKLPQQTD
ncbi:hypothetical protein L6164_019348 [Bauhinia variegata]|uniref:Uncharacterized protein n=1 Tax=Bauhinia variegata TaxID=167791 RepID=A0ACB9MRA9_BAUVA|nr:hypothetical protein L6164_019348 [Bauhinia variegata]